MALIDVLRVACARRFAVVASLGALALAGCSGGKRKDSDTVALTRAITAVTPGAETPLTELADAVGASNASLANLVGAVNGSGSLDDAADDAALSAAQLANAAAKTVEGTDARELEQKGAKKTEEGADKVEDKTN